MYLSTAPEEGSFIFQNGEIVDHSEESKDRTIMLLGVSSQKISVRLKRTVAHKSTQTESFPWVGGETTPGHFVLSSPRKSAQGALYVHSPASPCPSPALVRKRAFVKWENKESLIKPKPELHLRLRTYQELEQVPPVSLLFPPPLSSLAEVKPNRETHKSEDLNQDDY